MGVTVIMIRNTLGAVLQSEIIIIKGYHNLRIELIATILDELEELNF